MRRICQTLVEGRDRSRVTPGSGIKTAHELCEWMNGGLVIYSEPDQGCVVKFKVAASHKATSIFKSGKSSTLRVDLHNHEVSLAESGSTFNLTELQQLRALLLRGTRPLEFEKPLNLQNQLDKAELKEIMQEQLSEANQIGDKVSGSFVIDRSISLEDSNAVYLGQASQTNEIKNFFEKTNAESVASPTPRKSEPILAGGDESSDFQSVICASEREMHVVEGDSKPFNHFEALNNSSQRDLKIKRMEHDQSVVNKLNSYLEKSREPHAAMPEKGAGYIDMEKDGGYREELPVKSS